MYRRTVCPMYLSKLYIMIETYFLTLSSLSGFTVVYCLYFYSFSIHFRDHLAIILNVSVGFLSLFYLVLFTPIVLISFLLGPFCQLSPRRRLFKLCTRAYTIYIFILYTKSQISQPKSNYFC